MKLTKEKRTGCLKFFGQWFGRPYDNQHSIVGVEQNDQVLSVKFQGGEIMKVWGATEVKSSPHLEILGANRVQLAWNYDKPRTMEYVVNGTFVEHLRDGKVVCENRYPFKAIRFPITNISVELL